MPVGAPQPEPAVDILHGVKVVDPYRWLEDRDSDQTREWLSEQMRVHERYSRSFVDSTIFDHA